MTIRKSAEDYLYAIHRLRLSKGYTRSVDIAPVLSVSNPSVGNLRENGYISFNANNRISLTDARRSPRASLSRIQHLYTVFDVRNRKMMGNLYLICFTSEKHAGKVSSFSAGFALSMLSSEEYSKIEVLRG